MPNSLIKRLHQALTLQEEKLIALKTVAQAKTRTLGKYHLAISDEERKRMATKTRQHFDQLIAGLKIENLFDERKQCNEN